MSDERARAVKWNQG